MGIGRIDPGIEERASAERFGRNRILVQRLFAMRPEINEQVAQRLSFLETRALENRRNARGNGLVRAGRFG